MEGGGLEKVDLTTSPLSLAKAVLSACMQSKCDKETLRDVFLGFYATMLNTEMAQPSGTLSSINGDAARKQRIFPKKFTANYESKSFSINATSNFMRKGTQVTGDIDNLRASKSREKVFLSFSQLLGGLSCTRVLMSLRILALISMDMDIAATTTLALGAFKDMAGIATLSALLVG